MAYILPLGQAHGDNAWRSGPKAARLSALNSEGFKVPAGFAVTTDALSYFLAANTVAEEVGGILVRIDTLGAAELGEWPARLRQLIVEGTLPEDLADELHRAFDELNDGAVVVRSSSTLEDRADLSFAGQHDSFLNIQSFDACVSALKEVWASLYSDRALAYLRALDRSAQPLRMGVVVQQLVPANAAGVAFTVHPLSGDYEEIYISVALGLGEGTVSGEVAPDEVVVGRSTKEVLSYTIGAKAERVVANADGGTSRVEVEEGERGARALSGEQVLAVAELALKVEEAVGGDPHDVEWAFVGDELYLLQARPLVQKALAEGVEWRTPIPNARWRRNWRLGEWLPEAVTPLFGSWVLPILVAAREQFGTGRLGWKHRPTFSMPHPWFCIVNGYFYTRQDFPNWGKKDDKEEKSEADKRRERLEHMEGGKTHLRHWHDELLPGYIEHFSGHRQRDIKANNAQELIDFVEALAEEAGEIWYIIAPIGYGFEEMGFKPHYEEKIPEEGREHFSVFFSGYPSRIFDAQQALYDLAQRVRGEEAVVDQLANKAAFDELPPWLRAGIDAYARDYGHQLTSIDFYWPTSGEVLESLCQMLAAFASRDLVSPEVQRAKVAEHRDEAVGKVLAPLEGEEHEMMAALIDYYQTNASAREDANFYLQYGWPLMRKTVLELAGRLVQAKVLNAIDEAFFLEKDEFFGALKALEQGAAPASLEATATARRRTWEEWRLLDAPDVLGKEEEKDAEKGYFEDAEGKRIVAQGVSPGTCRGRVRIARAGDTALDLQSGEVLVTHAASPNLTPLMLVAGALVVEIGGGASHSSLVARELGLPAVVNAAEAMQVLAEGTLVEVDGTKGIVRIIEE